jgi:hypothetical protein
MKGLSMLRTLLVVPLLLLLAFLSFALDDQGNPNDPTVNDRANACYEDGSMAGKCDTAWEWEGGWYLIRFQFNLISREDFPTQYTILLPPLPEEETTEYHLGCFPVGDGLYAKFNDGNYLPSPATYYNNAACTNVWGSSGYALVYAPSGEADALTICQANGRSSVQLTPGGTVVYYCK